jgi:hypothetical protein
MEKLALSDHHSPKLRKEQFNTNPRGTASHLCCLPGIATVTRSEPGIRAHLLIGTSARQTLMDGNVGSLPRSLPIIQRISMSTSTPRQCAACETQPQKAEVTPEYVCLKWQ